MQLADAQVKSTLVHLRGHKLCDPEIVILELADKN